MKKIEERELFDVFQPFMEQRFQESCREIQEDVNANANQIWNELQSVIHKLLKNVEEMQIQYKKGKMQYLIFSFLRYGIYLNTLEICMDALDDNFYLDEREAAEYYCPVFLQDRYSEDVKYLFKLAGKNFVRLQNYEWIKLKEKYTEMYNSIIFHLIVNLSGQIAEIVMESNVKVSEDFMILYGEYMDKATVIYKKGELPNEIFSD